MSASYSAGLLAKTGAALDAIGDQHRAVVVDFGEIAALADSEAAIVAGSPKGRTYNADGDAQRPEQDPMSPPAAAAADPGHCDQPRGIKSIKDIMRYQPSIWSWFTNHGRRAGSSTRRSGVQASYYRDWLFSSAANWRMSPTKKSGSSQAAKCPAFSMS